MLAMPETQRAPEGASGPSAWSLLAAGLMGEAVLVFPLSLTGALVGSLSKEPCDEHCDGVTYWRYGAAVGGSLGVALGASSGMMLMGAAQGGHARWPATLGGATLGSALGLAVLLSTGRLMDPIVDAPVRFFIPPVGALVGALVGYQLSRVEADSAAPSFGLNGTQVSLILGGATLGSAAGIAGMLLINDSFYYPTPFLLEDKPYRFLLPLAGAALGALVGYQGSKAVAGLSSGSAASEGAHVSLLSGVAPMPGGGMVSVGGRF